MRTGRTAPDRNRRLQVTLTALAVLLLAAILVVLLVRRDSSTVTGSGVAATQVRPLAPFSRVDLEGDNNVVVRVGARQSVVVHGDRNLLGRVTTRIRAARLVIGTTPGSFSTSSPMFVEVRVPSLDGVTLQGNGNIAVSGIHSRRLAVALPGRGNIVASGSRHEARRRLGGEGTVRLHQLVARDATAFLGGAGTHHAHRDAQPRRDDLGHRHRPLPGVPPRRDPEGHRDRHDHRRLSASRSAAEATTV